MNECTCVRAFMYLVLDDSGIGLCFFHAFFFLSGCQLDFAGVTIVQDTEEYITAIQTQLFIRD